MKSTLGEYCTSTDIAEAIYLGASQSNNFAAVDRCRLATNDER